MIKNNIIAEIEILRSTKTPEEIEEMLLSKKLGNITTYTDGYQYIKSNSLSWLVIEARSPGFIEWMRKHPNKNVVHHEDFNPLNNSHSNLQIMSRIEHTSMHTIVWFADPSNAKAIKTANESRTKSLIDYHTDPKMPKLLRLGIKLFLKH